MLLSRRRHPAQLAEPRGPDKVNLLYLSPSARDRLLLRERGAEAGVSVLAVASGQQAMGAARLYRPDLIIIDDRVPDLPIQDMLQALRSDRTLTGVSVIVALRRPDQQRCELLRSYGATECLPELDLEALKRRVLKSRRR